MGKAAGLQMDKFWGERINSFLQPSLGQLYVSRNIAKHSGLVILLEQLIVDGTPGVMDHKWYMGLKIKS